MKRLYGFLLSLLLLSPYGAGGGGASPGTIPLDDWIKRLNGAEKKDWKAIAEELAKTLGLYVSAGSDFHGGNRPDRKLGITAGGRKI